MRIAALRVPARPRSAAFIWVRPMTHRCAARETPKCSRCGGERDRPGQRLCSVCHAIYQREWRRRRTRNYRAAVRSASRAEVRSGEIPRSPCTVCGDPNVELHHPDHEAASITVWMCRRCHLLWHEYWRETVLKAFCEWLEIARACDVVRKAEDAREAARRSEAA